MADLAPDIDETTDDAPLEPSPAQIYISAAQINRATAERIAILLIAKGYEVVWERDIGSPHSAARAAAHQAPCVIALFSRMSQTSKWVLDDAELALARDALIAVRLDPGSSRLPIGRGEPINLSGWNGENDDQHPGWRTLTGRIELLAGPPVHRAGSGTPLVIANVVTLVMFGVIFSLFAGAPLRGDREVADETVTRAPTAMGGPESSSEPESAPQAVVLPRPQAVTTTLQYTPTATFDHGMLQPLAHQAPLTVKEMRDAERSADTKATLKLAGQRRSAPEAQPPAEPALREAALAGEDTFTAPTARLQPISTK